MEGERRVLQDRVEAAALGLQRDARERVGREGDEQEEGDGDARLHGQHIGTQRGRQIASEEGDGGAEESEDEDPEQHGALVVPPHAGDLVKQRLCRVRVGPHVLDREIRGDVGVCKGSEGEGEQPELGDRGRLGDLHEANVAGARAPKRQRHLHQRHDEGQQDGEMSELDDHGRAPVLGVHEFPLPMPLRHGERVRVRGGQGHRGALGPPLTSCRRHGSAMTLSPR